MSDTIIDLPKIAQMLDAGWRVRLWKNDLNTYTAAAEHDNITIWQRAREKFLAHVRPSLRQVVDEQDWDDFGVVETDDFTPEQALTRLAYKVHGEILNAPSR
jgi:hypothetical protein